MAGPADRSKKGTQPDDAGSQLDSQTFAGPQLHDDVRHDSPFSVLLVADVLSHSMAFPSSCSCTAMCVNQSPGPLADGCAPARVISIAKSVTTFSPHHRKARRRPRLEANLLGLMRTRQRVSVRFEPTCLFRCGDDGHLARDAQILQCDAPHVGDPGLRVNRACGGRGDATRIGVRDPTTSRTWSSSACAIISVEPLANH